MEKGETSMFADKLGNTYPGLEVEKDLKKGLVDKIKSKVADSAANAAIAAAAKISDKLNLGVDLSVDIKIPNRFIVVSTTRNSPSLSSESFCRSHTHHSFAHTHSLSTFLLIRLLSLSLWTARLDHR